MTWSIVAHDRDTGEIGVAVATRFFAVGAIVPHVEPGVGAIASEAGRPARSSFMPSMP